MSDEPLVSVAFAGNQPEAEFIQSLLRDAGIPSMVRRSAAFDIPDFLAAGGRDILVPRSAEQAARELLAPQPGEGSDAGEPGEV